MRISDWSSDVCSSDLGSALCPDAGERRYAADVAERRTHGAVQARTGQALLRSAALRVVSRAARGQMADTGHRAGDIEIGSSGCRRAAADTCNPAAADRVGKTAGPEK